MQPKISSFFKRSAARTFDPSEVSAPVEDTTHFDIQEPEIRITYKRRTPKEEPDRNGEFTSTDIIERPQVAPPKLLPSSSSKTLNKKRTYAQFHLELGQSDFLLHTCSTCGFNFAIGDEGDEKVHKEFHKTYTHGIQFKGWRNERVILASEGARVISVLDGDPPGQMKKVQEVVKMVEDELGLGEGWLLHKHCKVYLFVLNQRIAGCLVVEPIKTAHRVISKSVVQRSSTSNEKAARPNSVVLRFGNVNFKQEIVKHMPSVDRLDVSEDPSGVILCEKDAVSAVCGIRAIWVAPFHRKKHVGTKLLDAARKSFSKGYTIEASQVAFSQPTTAGKVFASKYSGTNTFLVYHTQA
ncbi:hypothetical protein C5167_010022 [Papaver somniferum]|uniref:N-acetyltransferase domain-containing protein n=1 Tax=Papaver somniferum TaxID=3469 RepID=A0A4Y7JZ22_PAPSO|nr:protein CHROMOSOME TRANSMISSION FIDELITY 7-like [Papaver somniferum]XP_026393430.1 protein CHROMOSOME TRANSMISSION FIDELITY 7-like [Papaver somniferum]RZC66333.1 hypothetical protein C5167_010022 [Papaver somniferum]